MPRRQEILATGEIYHIFNRGLEKRPIFLDTFHYRRFFELLQFYQRQHHLRFSRLSRKERQKVIEKQLGEPLVEIICYCLMPNHFHVLLEQTANGGISRFIQLIADSYGKFFNIVHNRVGPVFQGKFRSTRIEDNAQLLHVTRYIHLNPVTAFLVKKPEDFKWSSYREYLTDDPVICSKVSVLDQFRSKDQYRDFVEDYADYEKALARIKHLILE